MRARLRTVLALDAAAIAATAAVFVLALGLPFLARRGVSPVAAGLLVTVAALIAAAFGGLLLSRSVASPIERIVDAAARLASADGLPVMGEGGGIALSRAAIAFERLAEALQLERRQLAAKVVELTAANRALGDAHASLARSERLATVGRLAAGLAHEIGNPLGAISGYVELARAHPAARGDEELGEALGRIAEATTRIDRTIRELLDFARPAQPRLASVELAGVIDAAVRLARVQPRFRDVEVTTTVPRGLQVWADEHHVAQVLVNLLLNAGDAMAGRGRVTIAATMAPDDRSVELALADEGPGIAPEHLPRVFDPFFTTKEPGQGTGLGLSISYGILESLGGSLVAENRPGGGAVFRVRLPAPPCPEGAC